MIKKILSLGAVLAKSEQELLIGGKMETDCYSHHTFCDESHPTSHDDFVDCMESCGC